MGRPKKNASKKKNPGSIDFKKIKRKVGRKLPPPTNSTDTQIRSKAIVLPEQSMLSNRTGMAVSRKGLTLKELLQQTSHHNAKTRKSALLGISDLLKKNPSELKTHRKVIMEKLCQLISDGDKSIRQILFNLLKKSIFPVSKEDASIIPLTMAYVFNAMTHLVLDIRLSAFNFFDLIVAFYPSSFYPYSDQIIDNYMHILQNSQTYIQDRVIFKSIIGGLERCLCLLSREKENTRYKELGLKKALFAYKEEVPRDQRRINSVILKLKKLLPILVICIQEFASSNHITPTIDGISFSCILCILQCIKEAVCFLLTEINQYCSSDLWQFRADSNKSIMCILIKLWQYFPFRSTQQMTEKEDERYYALNTWITEIYMHITNKINLTGAQKENSKERFLKFLEDSLNGQFCSDCHTNHIFQDKYLVSILPLFPGFVLDLECGWKNCLLEAFTSVFQDCKLESKFNLACLSAIEDMIPCNSHDPSSDIISPDYQHYQILWLKKLPSSLLLAGDTNPSFSKKILIVMRKMGQRCFAESSIDIEYNNLQNQFMEFFCTIGDDDSKNYGPFYKLPEDCQAQAMYCLAYFSKLNFDVLRSMLYCCLCEIANL
ncbi:hypothetical protein ZOSMA_195G00290 [Zostera marina]|uniref:Uncharacterized protein n=1 Tax=Zostera marina TaxID=29655 RepID=A0A0K9PNT3_ZOSMR|nr:hypothetical protein ZOSMA_195G00290 [Zostera marina]